MEAQTEAPVVYKKGDPDMPNEFPRHAGQAVAG